MNGWSALLIALVCLIKCPLVTNSTRTNNTSSHNSTTANFDASNTSLEAHRFNKSSEGEVDDSRHMDRLTGFGLKQSNALQVPPVQANDSSSSSTASDSASQTTAAPTPPQTKPADTTAAKESSTIASTSSPNALQSSPTTGEKPFTMPTWAVVVISIALLFTGCAVLVLVYVSIDEQGNLDCCKGKAPHEDGYTGHVAMTQINKGKLSEPSPETESLSASGSFKKETNKAILPPDISSSSSAGNVEFNSQYECRQISEADPARGMAPGIGLGKMAL